MSKIAIIEYPKSQLSAIYGISDIFNVASQIYKNQRVMEEGTTVDIVSTANSLPVDQYDFIVLPPSLDSSKDLKELNPWTNWFKEQHSNGCVLTSICAGAFILARTGLLNKRIVTTHWQLSSEFEDEFPHIEIDIDKILIDDGDIITAGGLMAWTDLGLRIVERIYSPTIMLKTARTFLVDPKGREQRFYSSFNPSYSHRDKQVLKAQHWLQSHFSEDSKIEALASISSLSERTFLRRFKKATKMTPSNYIQQLRLEKAKEHLELTPFNIEEIAWKVGYQDTNSFRRLFHKFIGLSPTEYRNRFSTLK